MPSILRNFIRTKKDKERDKFMQELQTVREHLQDDLHFWNIK